MVANKPDQRIAVLVVEDEALVRMMVADTLEEAGFNVIEACHAADALLFLEARPDIAVAVTDVEMPPGAMNGFELARLIRARHSNVQVLIVSGRMSPEPGELPEGGRFLHKPVRPEALVKMVQALLKEGSPPR
jgi:CheY-like chemotaxis protein